MDPASLAEVDDDDDNDTSLAGVPILIMTNDNNNDSYTESDHNSIDPNEADDNSSKASVHSTGSQAPIYNMTDEPPHLPWMRKNWIMQLETQVPVLH